VAKDRRASSSPPTPGLPGIPEHANPWTEAPSDPAATESSSAVERPTIPLPQPADSEIGDTARVQRFDPDQTPAPLPPSPAGEDEWFADAPTSPAGPLDLAAMAGRILGESAVGGTLGETALPGVGAVGPLPARAPTPTGIGLTGVYTARSLALPRPMWLLSALLCASSLAVGMVLGALLFGAAAAIPLDAGVCAPAPCLDSSALAGDAGATPPGRAESKPAN
jgi:hypothetical protein